MNLIEYTDKGLYCPPGDFYIDPWRAVRHAVITHGHGDHARWGSKLYMTHNDSLPILGTRLGWRNNFEGLAYNEVRDINGVKLSLHPAGHIIGSAQVRVEYKGEVWVVSGDYKTEYDGISPAFEPVRCHTFITESTFGLPIYNWAPQDEIFRDMNDWWRQNQERGITTVVLGYALGKVQRILHNLDREQGPIYLHGTIYNMHKALIEAGINIPYCERADVITKKDAFRKALIMAPPSAAGNGWLRRFQPYSVGVASGWMAVRGTKHLRGADKGFALSDHADWRGLNWAVKETGAERVYVTHGYTAAFSKWLKEQGLDARVVRTHFENGGDEQTGEDDDTLEKEGDDNPDGRGEELV